MRKKWISVMAMILAVGTLLAAGCSGTNTSSENDVSSAAGDSQVSSASSGSEETTVTEEPEDNDSQATISEETVDYDALYKEVTSLTDQDAIDFFNSLEGRGLTDDQILQFFINLPISEANKEIYDLYYNEQLDLYREEYPTPNFVDDYVWEMGSGTETTGIFSGLDIKLPFTDYISVETDSNNCIGNPERTYKIGVVFHGFDHPWLIAWADSAAYALEQYENVEYTILDAEYDNSQMATYIDQFIAEEVDGILVWPQEMAPTAAPIDRAVAAGIPVVTSDRLSGSENVNARVTGGLPSNGAQLGMYAAWKMAEEGNFSMNVIMLRKPLGGSSEALRTGNFLKVISYFPSVKILQSYHDTDSREEAFANAQAALSAYEDIDMFFCTGDHEVLAAIEATQQANRMYSRENGEKIIFVTPDDGKEDMYYIEEGILDMDVPLTPYQADIAVRVLLNIVIGKEVPYDVTVPNVPMITKDGQDIFGFSTQKVDDWYDYTFGPEV